MPVIKTIFFHILLSLRGLILGISKFLALIFLFGAALTTFIDKLSGVPLIAKIMMLFAGIIFTGINWFYDDLILHLQPKHLDVRLYR